MKTKIGTVLEEGIVQKLKERAAQERRPISEIIQDALINYLRSGSTRQRSRLEAV